MQLGEVYQEEAEAPPPKPTPKRRWLLWLSALAALAGALYVHGPGVMRVPGQTALVITNDSGWDLLGPPARVARRSPGWAFWVPIAQHAHPVSLQRHRPPSVTFPARTRDGVRLPLRDATITYRVDPQRAAHVFVEIGSRSKDWDPVVRAQLVGAWDAVIKTHDAADLAVGAPKDLVPAVKRRVRKALASQGFEVVAIDAPRWSPDPAVQTALNTLEEARISLQTAETETVKGMAQAAEADAAVQAERDTQWRGLQAILAAQREGAQIQGEAQVEQAREDAADRLRQARAKRAKHIARAQAVRAVTDARVQSLQARVDAARIAGPRMLDEAILKHVLPKLGRRAEPQK